MSCDAEPSAPASAETARAAFLSRLDAAKYAAAVAEEDFRREAAARTEALARERAHAWRRADLMGSLSTALAGVDDAEMAAAAGEALLRARLGWRETSEAREEVLARFSAVSVALFEARDAQGGAPDAALAAFEAWYQSSRQSPFWYLFEHYIPDTPLIDF